FHTFRACRRAFLAGDFAHAQNHAEKKEVVNGRAIYCVTAKRLPGVGAASPDRNTCHAACVRYYKCTFCPGVDTKRQPKKNRASRPEGKSS
ncbi:hypothetical protein, partial [Enterobacter asburiae]|uniref:hypothetical protein n=2 Tax=Enterobacter cloacae complex TaxID=354276 RepID=UPI002FE55ECA